MRHLTLRRPAYIAGIAVVLAVLASGARALPPLAENDRVMREFLAGAVGDELRKNCPAASARMLYVLGRVRELERYAYSLGYTKADIDAMRKDPANKAKLNAMRDEYLARNGVVKGDAASYCTLAKAEVEKKSLIGSLLRVR